jgi:adhesin transport system membrane fusion protein
MTQKNDPKTKLKADDLNIKKSDKKAIPSEKKETKASADKLPKVKNKSQNVFGKSFDHKKGQDTLSKGQTVLAKWFNTEGWEDGEFMDDVSQATLRGAHPAANVLFWTCTAFIVIMITWANYAELDEVTHGEGKVIPSTKLQEVEHGEGGIVTEILVREGDVVLKGEPLLRIDDTEFSSSLEERRTKYHTLLAEIARLQHELSEDVSKTSIIEYPLVVKMEAPGLINSQNNIYQARKNEERGAFSILGSQLQQKSQELKEAQARAGQTARAYAFSKQELDMTKPLLKEGAVSEVEILRLERTVNDLLGEKETSELAVKRAEFAVEESQERLAEINLKFRTEALTELGEKQEEMQRMAEVLKADNYRVDRTTVRAPVDSSVKRVLVNTIGSVIGKDEVLVELIPMDDKLLVEAKIRPKDIAFLRPHQKAKVKITAYDFSIYGGLDAELEFIGADTVTDENGNPFYHIRVRTDRNHLGKDDQKLPIIPGMVATVDILTGKKTVLEYILKPFNKMRENALRER